MAIINCYINYSLFFQQHLQSSFVIVAAVRGLYIVAQSL